MAKKINHYRRILSKKTIPKNKLTPGMIISFRYKGKDIYDKIPLILFLYNDISTNLIHGLNLNYLYEKDVQDIFETISKKVNISIEYDENEKGNSYVVLNKNPKSKIGFGAKKLYEQVIRPSIFSMERTKNCYRTYKLNNISNLMLINYRLDIIEKYIREQTDLSKNDIKSNELFKVVKEQQIETKTDNVRVEKQDEIRKDIQK
jgi:hypothetical protein